MAKVIVDASTCVGCGLCVNSCPEIFEMGDDGIAKTKDVECTNCDIYEIASQCPVSSITVED